MRPFQTAYQITACLSLKNCCIPDHQHGQHIIFYRIHVQYLFPKQITSTAFHVATMTSPFFFDCYFSWLEWCLVSLWASTAWPFSPSYSTSQHRQRTCWCQTSRVWFFWQVRASHLACQQITGLKINMVPSSGDGRLLDWDDWHLLSRCIEDNPKGITHQEITLCMRSYHFGTAWLLDCINYYLVCFQDHSFGLWWKLNLSLDFMFWVK